jgi:hypothetical protein
MSIACVFIDEVVVALTVIGEVRIAKEKAWSSIVDVAACFRRPRLVVIHEVHAWFKQNVLRVKMVGSVICPQ